MRGIVCLDWDISHIVLCWYEDVCFTFRYDAGVTVVATLLDSGIQAYRAPERVLICFVIVEDVELVRA